MEAYKLDNETDKENKNANNRFMGVIAKLQMALKTERTPKRL